MSALTALSRLETNPSDEEPLHKLVDAALVEKLSSPAIIRLATLLARSGERLEPDADRTDFASTGAPSSLSTLLVPLYMRAAGMQVASLGVPGRPAGAIDVLANVPGYRPQMSASEAARALHEHGIVHLHVSELWAPLDARLFSLRQERAAQQISGLVIASVLAKQLALGVNRLGLDIRVAGYGNFGTTWDEAHNNAQRFTEVSSKLGVSAKCFLTDATRPYQPYIGRGESLIALDEVLEGSPSLALKKHVGECQQMAVDTITANNQRRVTKDQLRSAFVALLAAHGTTIESFKMHVEKLTSTPRHAITAEQEGRVRLDLLRLRDVLTREQRRAERNSPGFADPTGVTLAVQPGQSVSAGTDLLLVRGWEDGTGLADAIDACVQIEDGSATSSQEATDSP